MFKLMTILFKEHLKTWTDRILNFTNNFNCYLDAFCFNCCRQIIDWCMFRAFKLNGCVVIRKKFKKCRYSQELGATQTRKRNRPCEKEKLTSLQWWYRSDWKDVFSLGCWQGSTPLCQVPEIRMRVVSTVSKPTRRSKRNKRHHWA